MAEKEDHMTTHETTNGDGLPPVRSGNISATKESVSITVYHRVWLLQTAELINPVKQIQCDPY